MYETGAMVVIIAVICEALFAWDVCCGVYDFPSVVAGMVAVFVAVMIGEYFKK